MTGEIKVKSEKLKVKSCSIRLRRVKILLFLLALVPVKIFAQEISISAVVDNNKAALDDLIVLTINISGNVSSIPNPTLPKLQDFHVYSSESSQNVSIINGKMSVTTSFNYVLAPKKEGKFVIGPVELSFRGRVYKTEPINVEITPSTRKGQAKSQPAAKPITRGSRSGDGDVFIETSVNKKRAYLNEQVTLSFKFYTRIRLFENPEYIPPEKTGFWVEDLPPQVTGYENRDGSQYQVTEIKTALFPTNSGKLTIGPATLKYTESSDPFGFFLNSRPVTLKTEPITIDVLPLPEEKPGYFKGTVGVYNIESEIDKNEVQAGKPINYKIKIKGEGNIKVINEPELGLPDDFKVYPSGSSDNVKKMNYRVQGDKTYEYYIIPRKPGKLTIPGINYPCFNPETGKYVTLKTKDFLITVKQSAEEETVKENLSGGSPVKEEVRLITKDIRPIKLYLSSKKERLLVKKHLLLLIISLPMLLLIFAKIYSRHYEQIEFNPVYKREKRANKLVQKRFKEANRLMVSGDKKDYCHLIAKSILGFIGDKLNIAEMGLTSETLKDILKVRNISEDAQKRIIEFLDKCDYIEFSPVEPEPGWRNKIYDEAKEIVLFLEKQKWQKN
ncbi:MAG: BatD family protein [bacterium]